MAALARPPAEAAAIADLVAACRILAADGQGDLIWGHVSVRRPDHPDQLWLKGAGLGLEEITEDDLIVLDLAGEVQAGSRPLHLEWPIHAEILRARPDVNAVVHTHPIHATTFGALETPLRPISHEGARFAPPDVPRFRQTSDLIVTPDLGRALAATLGDRNAVLLRNHGIVTAGPDVATACLLAICLERACRTQLLALATGLPIHESTPEDALAKRARLNSPGSFQTAWEYLRRITV